jgi:anti-sigma regulatory factor (Ser/Thr protein kinase)
MEITISVNRDDGFLHGLAEVLRIIDFIDQSSDSEDVISFQSNVFITPLFILPLLVYVNGCKKKITFEYSNSYLDTIRFRTGGLKTEELKTETLHDIMKMCSNKTYIPIISFPTDKKFFKERNEILTAIENIILRQVKAKTNISIALKYLIGESVDNIVEHSDSERGYIFSQAYPNKEFLDICIADNGISLLGSYMKLNNIVFNDHLSAMKAANSGYSTKNLPDAENRGYGIATSKKMLVDGLSGFFVMLSGNALFLKSKSVDQYSELPKVATWKGTIVAMRIPYVSEYFNYINFVQ